MPPQMRSPARPWGLWGSTVGKRGAQPFEILVSCFFCFLSDYLLILVKRVFQPFLGCACFPLPQKSGESVQAVKLNVFHTMNFMLKHCDAIREKVRSGQLEIQGGVYDLSTGKAPGFRQFVLGSFVNTLGSYIVRPVSDTVSINFIRETALGSFRLVNELLLRSLIGALVGTLGRWSSWEKVHKSPS